MDFNKKIMVIPSASMGIYCESSIPTSRTLVLERFSFSLESSLRCWMRVDPHNKFLQHRISEPLVENLPILMRNNTDRNIEIFDVALIDDTDTRVQAEMVLPTTMYNKYRGCLIELGLSSSSYQNKRCH